MHFTRIRVSGFKSFVEPAEFLIEPGMTGLVGPNGCGKSNLVEALRWVMGESSAKKMRGGEMDDVIFSGSASRPARNVAEVALTVNNRDRDAPAAFNDADELVVVRRIERGSGSSYRINGREVRAQDVKLLFADSASGANSTAMVGQGEIGDVISAKPTARRLLLEEAAGITGLHARRHEAELRLRGADTNMARLDDALAMLEDQLRGLKRQARQAARYRNISGHIRRAEAIVLHHQWSEATAGESSARAAHDGAERTTAVHTAAAAWATTARASAAEALPDLRQSEAAEAARLHRLTLARDALDAEERRIEDARAEVAGRLEQIAADAAREEARAADAADALAQLDDERGRLDAGDAEEASGDARAAVRDAAADGVARQEAVVDELTSAAAASGAERAALRQRSGDENARVSRLQGEIAELAEERERLAAQAAMTVSGADPVARARRQVEDARAAARAAAPARTAAQAAESTLRDSLPAVESQAAALRAEIDTHAALAPDPEGSRWPPLIDSVSVQPGYEAALAAALGDDLSAAADSKAPAHWRALTTSAPAPALPLGVEPLTGAVKGPELLVRRLAQVGVVAAGDGARLQAVLAQGQRLVSREGDLWRWDGYTVAAAASAAQAKRLARRKRVRALRGDLEAAETALAETQAKLRSANAAAARAVSKDASAAEAAHAAEAALTDALDARAQAAESAARRTSRRSVVDETLARLAAEAGTAGERRDDAEARLSGAADDAENERTAIEAARRDLEELRGLLAVEEAHEERRRRETDARASRRAAIAEEDRSWRSRAGEAQRQSEILARRRVEADETRDRLEKRPREIAAERATLFAGIDAAEAARAAAADRLAEAEEVSRVRERELKAAESALSAAREDRVRAEAAVAHAEMAAREVARRIAETLECSPEKALAAAEIAQDAALPDAETAAKRIERLKRERDNMGAVNLRAEAEAEAISEQFEALGAERRDLEAAISRLRHGIASLNREGRQRLLSAFETVNDHFGKVFVRLFGGGRAHLALVDSDDPLEAGLEIMASPPGKRLQVLSLLSGGEQAMTTLALLFAVFSTNPAPICVLDEVDAPLDDANVERFCALVEDFVEAVATRFVVVTHNAFTMARMDRLFGVTMRERGVSQIVSVDLSLARVMQAAE